MTRAPARAADPVAASGNHDAFNDYAFDDRFPTQPIAVGRPHVEPVLDGRHTRAPDATNRRMSSAHRAPHPSWQHHAAPARGVSHREPRRSATGSPRSTILIAVAVVIAATVGALGYQSWAATHDPSARSTTSPATAARQAEDVPRGHPPPGGDVGDRDAHGAVGQADGVVPDGVTVFDDEFPAVAELDPGLLKALRRAAKDAADDRITFYVNSGWRSREYQNQLLREAISKYGSEEEAARWVATADTSPHVSGDAVDIGPTAAAAWLAKHGVEYGLCQIYRNEPWHYELRPDAANRGCPRMYADPTHDPRMQK
jgi:zinc D-Ala-D-Ala carboxypeptidase